MAAGEAVSSAAALEAGGAGGGAGAEGAGGAMCPARMSWEAVVGDRRDEVGAIEDWELATSSRRDVTASENKL